MEFKINGCVCARMSFAALLELCEQQHLDLAALKQQTGAGTHCKHCRPWLEKAFSTKCVSFAEDSSTLRNGEILLQHFHPNEPD